MLSQARYSEKVGLGYCPILSGLVDRNHTAEIDRELSGSTVDASCGNIMQFSMVQGWKNHRQRIRYSTVQYLKSCLSSVAEVNKKSGHC